MQEREIRFAAPAGPAARGRRAVQVHAVTLICSASRASTDAHMMHAVAICARAAAAAAILKGSWPFFTDNMLDHHAVVEVLDDHRQRST